MRASLALGLVLVAGCVPPLAGDGFYRCAREGRCPASAPFCGADGLCHVRPMDGSDVSTVDGGADVSIDAPIGPPPISFRNCQVMSDCDPGELCHRDTDPTSHVVSGFCTRACLDNTDCPMFAGVGSSCIGAMPAGVCLRPCTGASDCVFPLLCTMGGWGMGTGPMMCGTFDDAFPLPYYEACSIDANCPHPLRCLGGRCLRECSMPTACVFGVEGCATGPGGVHACLENCDASPTDCDLVSAATCVGSSPALCRPSGW